MMTDYELEQLYDEILNDSYGEIKLGYLTFLPADIIKNCDPIAYRVGLSDFESTLEEE
jgi:hypothetical protein